jgi:tRNA A-37 threonylcarbamoyl transferase component Bud32
MATVYRARDRRLAREVAVKIIHRHLRENQEVARRFVAEALAVAKLRHANIVEVYDVSDADDDERYLVVELVRGITLRMLLSTHGHLPAEIAAIIGVEVGSALDHAHGLGVIHRDVKPENVLIATPRELDDKASERPSELATPLVKITDFGIAKLLDAQGVTSTGQVLGSPAHMAPEQIEGGDVSARSDVFGLGVLLYEAMVGKLPFEGKNPAQVLRRVLEGSFTPADKALPTVGAGFAAIVSKALAHKQEDRFASAAELCEALQKELDALGFTDLRKELRSFLCAPEAYVKAYEPRVVEQLILRAEQAREARLIPISAACLNRALAFRPSDASLVAEVASHGRRERLRRNLKSAGRATVASMAVAGIGFALFRVGYDPEPVPPVSTTKADLPARPAERGAAPAPERSVARSSTVRETAPPRPKSPTAPPRERPQPVQLDPAQTVPVKILVTGPQAATVKIDGEEKQAWFGATFQLTVGPHRFEFVPPPGDPCCDARAVTFDREIRLPEKPGEIVYIRGVIPFRPATLFYQGVEGGHVECMGREIRGKTEIAMNQARLGARCSFFPPAGSSQAPESFDVALTPGLTLAVPPL